MHRHPELIIAYKMERKLEVWVLNSNRQLELRKIYEFSGYSGDLGPKRIQGDGQIPEGFYFPEYEQNLYEKYQETAEREIIAWLNALPDAEAFLDILKQWGAECACRFIGYREITVRLKSGLRWKVRSPVFLKAKPERRRGGKPKRQKGVLRHLGLELLGIIKRISPALIQISVSMAVLRPSFEVAANALRGLGVIMNERLLQNITMRSAGEPACMRIVLSESM
ncbi:hypothetical protein QUF90_11165 [Desulfococcaceae bacterium HSG9]|nr:hypothetical protein [Desulfococcaceae bacterium HSG9]